MYKKMVLENAKTEFFLIEFQELKNLTFSESLEIHVIRPGFTHRPRSRGTQCRGAQKNLRDFFSKKKLD